MKAFHPGKEITGERDTESLLAEGVKRSNNCCFPKLNKRTPNEKIRQQI